MSSAEPAERAREFFAVGAPQALLARRAFFDRVTHGRCRIELSAAQGGVDTWVVDVGVSPPAVHAGDGAPADCYLSLASDDFVRLLDEPWAGQMLAWQGRMSFGGDHALLRRVSDVLFPGPEGENGEFAGYYATLSRLVPDERLTFMNHGHADEHENFDWLDEVDRPWRYSIDLVRRTLDGTEVRGAHVLDVGCGRGGPAAWVAGYLGPAEVVGVDACEEAIAFCKRRHRRDGLSFVHGHADRLPRADASVDVVMNVESSHCYVDRGAFLAEVARVLRPGGTFCCADVFKGDQLDRTQRLLDDVPGLGIVESADITKQVARAIERNRETLAALLTSAVDSELRNEAIIAHLVRSINVNVYDNYVSGAWRYHALRVEKAA